MFAGGTGEECYSQLTPQGKLTWSECNYSDWKLARYKPYVVLLGGGSMMMRAIHLFESKYQLKSDISSIYRDTDPSQCGQFGTQWSGTGFTDLDLGICGL